jgi:putative peptidoglycan lipid II flippase
MSRRIAAGDVAAAHGAQNRAIGFTLALTIPFFVAFLTLPELIMAALFQRGAFDENAVRTAGAVLSAYAVGLPAIVLITSSRASFYARSDTKTPLIASLTGIAVNVALKIVLMGPFGVVGLALATAVGTWINLILLVALAYRRDWTAPSGALGRIMIAVLAAGLCLALFAIFAPARVATALAWLPAWRDETLLALLGTGGALVYGAVLFGSLKLLRVRLARR